MAIGAKLAGSYAGLEGNFARRIRRGMANATIARGEWLVGAARQERRLIS